MGQDLYDGRSPQVGSLRTAAYRQVTLQNERFLPGVWIIDGALSRDTGNTPVTEIRAGMPLAMVTSSKKLRPSVIGVTTAAVTAGSTTSLTVGAAVATEVQRLITAAGTSVVFNLHGPQIAGGTISTQAFTATAASGTAITCSAVTLLNYVAGSIITPSVADHTLFATIMPNGYPKRVVDEDNASRDMDLELYLVGGLVDSSQLLFWPSDTALRAYFISSLSRTGQSNFEFDSLHGA